MHATLLWTAALALAALAASSGAAQADRSSPVADSCPEAPKSLYLAAMEEPPLHCGALEATETYRFLWVHSLYPRKIAVRVFRRGDDYGLAAVILDTIWDGARVKPGNVSRRVIKTLAPDQWRTVIAKLEELQFWQMATRNNVLPGVDGVTWIVEGRRDGRYHEVMRWSGTDLFEPVGRLFLDLAGLWPVY